MASSRNICAIIARSEKLKLCPYRNELPATADEFLWGHSMFNTLGRFKGLNDEMGFIVRHSLAEYPAWQAEAALAATAQQLVHVATGEGTNGWIATPTAIIERYIPAQIKPMRAAHQQHWDSILPRSTGSTFRSRWDRCCWSSRSFGDAIWRRRLDDLTLLAATVRSPCSATPLSAA